MRVNLRKFIIVGCVLFLLWIIISYSSMIELPRSSGSGRRVVELEKRIGELQRKLDNQVKDSNDLLAQVKINMKKAEQEKKDTNDSNGIQKTAIYYYEGSESPILPVLVIACNRVTVKRCLDNLVKFRPNKDTFPIIVSQDCGHNATYKVIKGFVDQDPSISVVKQPDLSEIPLPKAKIKFRGYYKIARHFKFALDHVFETLGHEAVIIVEDDLDISPDFFEYFLGTYPLLLKDESLWCISAWNDNGKRDVIDVSRPELVHRTEFFPGLGWLLRRPSWRSLRPRWPAAFFDDWLRNPENTEGRACLRPEISRTYSFGKVGVSKGLFFDLHLRNIQLNMDFVEFTKLDLGYLLKDRYDTELAETVSSLPEMTAEEVMSTAGDGSLGAVRVPYSDAKSYQRQAKKLGLMDDFRSGVPRTAYHGIVTCFVRGRRVYLAPSYTWTSYDPSWG